MTTFLLADRVHFREVGTDAWLPADIPGSVHTDLLALDLIPDPFVSDNELQVLWVAERDWEYQLSFQVTAEALEADAVHLVCDGLDTLAMLELNGQAVGETDNAFRQYRWEVKRLLHEGENTLHIVFPSTVNAMQQKQLETPLIGPWQSIPGGPHVRKAPCQFGWDWGPQLPPIGIWKPLRLEVHHGARLDQVEVRQVHSQDEVVLEVKAELERWSEGEAQVALRLVAPDGSTHEKEIDLANNAQSCKGSLTVQSPQLWWPNGYGAQPLYLLEVTLKVGDRQCDQRSYKLGLRTLELRQEPDAFGTSFTFVINGLPIFAKGANWIPADSFPSRLTEAHLERLIESSALANMNMLRVWGGGFYEEDRFYDLCDRYGILVWQDFVFSCSIYPDDEAFVANVREEAVQNIRRLRHHASLALWCGNNEMEWGWANWGWAERADLKYREAYDRMFHHLLPELCAAEDPDRPYWPSSPSSGVPFENPGGVHAGDTHNWEVWHGGYPFEHYREHPSRFVSEFGFQSLPPLETIRTYAQPEDWNMTSYVMEHHQRNASGNGKIVNYMTAHFRMPKDFPSMVYLSQLLQAQAVRTGVEFWRRNRACTSGALYWQLNDCWPVASWASLDYYGRWKALHYTARRFFAPLLLTAEASWGKAQGSAALESGHLFQRLPGPYVSLHLVSDRTTAWKGSVRWSLETLAGDVLKSESLSVTVSPGESVQVRSLDLSDLLTPDNERQVVLVYELWEGEQRISADVLTFVPSKHLKLASPALDVAIGQAEGGYEIEITAQQLARFVWLDLPAAPDAIFSDNYFDLPAGRSVRVLLPDIEGWTVDKLAAELRVSSLYDTF